MEPFEPDSILLELLGTEHKNGTWVGPELLPIANRVRNLGGSEDDYRRWVLASYLWTSYTCSTNDSVKKQETALDNAWERSSTSEDFDLETALSDLAGRIAVYTRWQNKRTASRDRAVALAFVRFCIEHNCFTRTISSYELAKWTAGISQKSVSRALIALIDYEFIREVERTDKRTSDRSAKRYRLNLRWAATSRHGGVSNNDSRNTGRTSLSHELTPPLDIWSRKGLGPGAQRVYEALDDEPTTARQLHERTGMSIASVKRFLKILADACLAGSKTGAAGEASLYFRVDTPLDAVAEALGVFGHVDVKRWELEQRQAANKAAYPGSYRTLAG